MEPRISATRRQTTPGWTADVASEILGTAFFPTRRSLVAPTHSPRALAPRTPRSSPTHERAHHLAPAHSRRAEAVAGGSPRTPARVATSGAREKARRCHPSPTRPPRPMFALASARGGVTPTPRRARAEVERSPRGHSARAAPRALGARPGARGAARNPAAQAPRIAGYPSHGAPSDADDVADTSEHRAWFAAATGMFSPAGASTGLDEPTLLRARRAVPRPPPRVATPPTARLPARRGLARFLPIRETAVVATAFFARPTRASCRADPPRAALFTRTND